MPHKKFATSKGSNNVYNPNHYWASKSNRCGNPQLKGKIDGIALRVPVVSESITDIVMNYKGRYKG